MLSVLKKPNTCWVAYFHSGITWVSVNSVLRALQVPADLTFLCPSRIDCSDLALDRLGHKIELPQILRPPRARKDFWNAWPEVRAFDHPLEQALQGRAFICLLPHTGLGIGPMLATHRKCLGFCYYEEGLASYDFKCIGHQEELPPPDRSSWQKLKEQLLYPLSMNRRHPMPHYFYEWNHPNFLQVFSLYPEAFPGVEPKTVVTWNFPPHVPEECAQGYLILSPILDQPEATQGALDALQAMKRLMGTLKINSLVIRLHPDQPESCPTAELVSWVFEDWLTTGRAKFSRKPACLELHLESAKPAIFHFGSSLGYYASRLGCNVYCGLSRLKLGYDSLRNPGRYSFTLPSTYLEL